MYVTKRQKEILTYLKTYLSQKGYAPTFKEIADHFSFKTKGTVYKHIKTLKEKGLINHQWNRPRAIELGPSEKKLTVLPVLGSVSKKNVFKPAKMIEQLQVPEAFLRSGGHFLLKVSGDSWRDEHIIKGDYIVVQETNVPVNGEIIIALINGKNVTIKKFYKKNGGIELQSVNDKKQCDLFNAESVVVQGVIVGILRRY